MNTLAGTCRRQDLLESDLSGNHLSMGADEAVFLMFEAGTSSETMKLEEVVSVNRSPREPYEYTIDFV